MEALAVESKNYVYAPYYELAMQGRYTRDDEGKSNEMLDLIFDTVLRILATLHGNQASAQSS